MPCVPTGSDEVVIASSGQTVVIENVPLAVLEAESVTWMVGVSVTACVGVPLINPALFIDMPVGNVPAVTAHVYGGVPPVAVIWSEYA